MTRARVIPDVVVPAPAALDLFCGVGGLSEGVARAGGRVVLAVDRDPLAVLSARSMGHPAVVADVDGEELYAGLRGSIDLVVAGPPCQGLSEMGAGAGAGDPRDGFPALLRALDRVQPAAVLIETVRGFLTRRHRSLRERLLEQLAQRFDQVGVWALEAQDYGVAQRRRRVFVWGAPERLRDPTPTHGQGTPRRWVGVRDVLPELGAPAVHQRSVTARSRCTSLPAPTITTKGTLYTSPAPGIVLESRMVETGADGGPAPPGIRRRLTVMENASLQALEGWTFHGGSTVRYRQVGNAVPPPLAEAAVRPLLDCIRAVRARSR